MDVFENLDLVNKKLDNLTKELGTANADLQDTRVTNIFIVNLKFRILFRSSIFLISKSEYLGKTTD